MGSPPIKTTRFIALLRAINVGGHNVKTNRLSKLFESLRLSNIERHLRESLGYEVATFKRSTPELADIAYYQLFATSEPDEEGNSLYIAFLPAQPDDEAQQRLLTFRTEVDDFHVHERGIY